MEKEHKKEGDKEVEKEVEKLSCIFGAMVNNRNDRGQCWKNIPLAREALAIMKSLPDTVGGEFDSPAEKAGLLCRMLEQMDEMTTPRLAIEVRTYIHTLHPDDGENLDMLRQLNDFIDLDFPMAEYCKKYGLFLKFDPVERTPEWEEIIFDVECVCGRRLAGTPRSMGFCFVYWHEKAKELRSRGIWWNSPAAMNPHVMFD